MSELRQKILDLPRRSCVLGILVMLFQWGWGESVFNFHSNGGITPWLPMFLFVILFGLSTDYHVFILSRVREAYGRGLSNEQAVAHGIKQTAGVVTSAAVVMVVTFAVFATMPIIDFKEMGVGLAAAILIDATLIRAVLLPATMKLLGDRNWYLPRWLDWLPKLDTARRRPLPPSRLFRPRLSSSRLIPRSLGPLPRRRAELAAGPLILDGLAGVRELTPRGRPRGSAATLDWRNDWRASLGSGSRTDTVCGLRSRSADADGLDHFRSPGEGTHELSESAGTPVELR